MPNEEQEKKLRDLIVDELGCDELEVTPQARFRDDLGADSLDSIELSMRVEEEFDIEIAEEDTEKLQTVADLYTYVESRTQKAVDSQVPTGI